MKTTESDDLSYLERVAKACYQAVLTASAVDDGDQGIAVVNANEACAALAFVAALLMEPAPECATPKGLRDAADNMRSFMLSEMKNMRREYERTGVRPFDHEAITPS